MDFLKTITGKIAAGVATLVVVVIGITWWQMDPSTRESILSGTGKILGWLMLVLLVPWASFFLIGWVAKFESNLAGALLVFGYTVLETLLLAWLFDWDIHGAAKWTFLGGGALLAGVYNLFTCDWLAEKVG